ncbi:unnamed protein product, partial [Durusdinium trenchii]
NKSVSVVPGNTLRMLRPCVLRGLWKRRLAGRCISSSASSTWSEWATWAGWRQEEGPPQRILRLTGPVKLYKEAASEEVLQDLTSGELLIGVGEEALQVGSDVANGWLFVRRPTEESVEIMSDKPLEYQDGWIHLPDAPVEMAEHQLGDRLAGRVDVPDHPVTNVLKALPFCRGQELPDWIPGSVCELHTGKVGGVLKGGRFLLQRPSGAVDVGVLDVVDKKGQTTQHRNCSCPWPCLCDGRGGLHSFAGVAARADPVGPKDMATTSGLAPLCSGARHTRRNVNLFLVHSSIGGHRS